MAAAALIARAVGTGFLDPRRSLHQSAAPPLLLKSASRCLDNYYFAAIHTGHLVQVGFAAYLCNDFCGFLFF